MTAPHPEGVGVVLVMKNALQSAGVQPQEIDYINAHGTSTQLGDLNEINAIQQVFGKHAYKLNISSTKSMTGHLLGASGAIESIASLLTIQHQSISPTINNFTHDKRFSTQLNFTSNKLQKKTVKMVLSNTFGFGGHNCSIIFKKI